MASTPGYFVDMQPDAASTPGVSAFNSLETTAVNAAGTAAADALTMVAPNGQYRYDPNNQNFRALPQVRNVSASTNPGIGGGGVGSLLVIAFVLWLVFK